VTPRPPASTPDAGAVCPNRSCFVLGPHRSGTTIVCKAVAASGAFVCLTAADVVAFHERSGAAGTARGEQGGASGDGPREHWGDRSALARMESRGETRKIDAVRVAEDLPEEYGFLLPDLKLTPETAPVVASVYRELAGEGARDARYLLRNPWDLATADRIPDLFPKAEFVFVVRDPVKTIDSQLQAVRTAFADPSEYLALLALRYRRIVRRPLKLALFRFLTGRPRAADLLTRSFARTTTSWLHGLERLQDDRYIVTRHEDLIADPAKELGRVYSFLGLPTERIPAVAREIRPGSRTLHPHVVARIPKIRDRTRRYRERFGY